MQKDAVCFLENAWAKEISASPSTSDMLFKIYDIFHHWQLLYFMRIKFRGVCLFLCFKHEAIFLQMRDS